jgi:hypothetical protein
MNLLGLSIFILRTNLDFLFIDILKGIYIDIPLGRQSCSADRKGVGNNPAKGIVANFGHFIIC